MTRDAYLRIKAAHDLPSPSGVAVELLRLAHQEDTTLAQIAGVVQTDPAISIRLLRLVNSAFSGIRDEVTSIHRSVVLLGIKTVTRLALCFSLLASGREGRCRRFNYDLYWSDSLGRAIAARVIAQRLHTVPADEAFTFGLLCQIGRLALATAYPEAYATILEQAPTGDVSSLAHLERAQFQLSHCDLAAEMLTDWGMPAEFCNAVRAQLDPEAIAFDPNCETQGFARVLRLSGVISSVLTREAVLRDSVFELTMQANRLGMAPEVQHDLFDRIREEWRELGTVLSVRTQDVPSLDVLYAEAERLRESFGEEEPSAYAGTAESLGGRT